jgi:diguanylate cyclase (GGDEF)-like protein/PAS domain S-box-containing protein
MRSAREMVPVRDGPTDAGQEQELLRRQVYAAMHFARPASAAHAINVVVLGVYAAAPALSWFRIAWLAFALPASALRALVWWHGERHGSTEGDHHLARRYRRVTMVEVILQGALTGVLAIALLPTLDAGRQMVLITTAAGMLGVGAAALSTTRSMAILWVVVHLVTVVPAMLLSDEPALRALSLLWVAYSGVLVAGAIYLADSFRQRSLAELAARDTQQAVELLLDDFEDGSRDWLWETDAEGTFSRVSERLCHVTGSSQEELLTMRLTELLERLANKEAGGEQAVAALSDVMARGGRVREHIVPVVVDGRERWWSLTAKPHTGFAGQLFWRGVGTDATDEIRHQQEMVQMASTDTLTGLANRRLFYEHLHDCIRLTPERGCHLAVFDLDNFKAVNDTLGHQVGDVLLAQIASRLAAVSGPDFVARLGGDEFGVIISAPEPADPTELRVGRFQRAFDAPFTVEGNILQVGASVGCATTVGQACDAQELVRRADLALYDAKLVRSGRLSMFTPEMSIRARGRSSLISDLGRAIDQDEFVFYYQSQHDLDSGRVVGAEALLRWHHPARGVLPPSEFLDKAEESGLLVPIGAIMLRQVCSKLSAVGSPARIAINVSQGELTSPSFVRNVEGALQEFGIEPGRLEVEVTESAAATPASDGVLRQLRRLGLRVAIDDFGTGYSSLARIQEMPVDLLKVDRAFVVGLGAGDERSRDVAVAIMRSAINIASALGIQTLAEGVERRDQLEQVHDLGFDLVQGFLMGVPEPDEGPATPRTPQGS